MQETKTTVEDIEDGVATIEIDNVQYNVNIENKFEEWLQEKAEGMQNSLTNEELDYQTIEFTSESLKNLLGHNELIIEWTDNNDITSEIESVFNCCGNEQEFSQDSNICNECKEHFI